MLSYVLINFELEVLLSLWMRLQFILMVPALETLENGGWGAVLIYNNIEKQISGASADTTNNQMELTAPIKALELLKRPCKVKLYSDSAYLVNAFTQGWIYNWHKNGWKTAGKSDVKNRDLWEKLYSLSQIHDIEWIKVKGHSSNEYNNLCDKLAVDAYNNL